MWITFLNQQCLWMFYPSIVEKNKETCGHKILHKLVSTQAPSLWRTEELEKQLWELHMTIEECSNYTLRSRLWQLVLGLKNKNVHVHVPLLLEKSSFSS